ncbi:MAG TPA: ZIP family metal transporter [Bacteroidota bacterium]|nr:ZIP family metal transporter [Bacteroidota bacterium]
MNQTLIVILAGLLASAAEIVGGSLVVFKSTLPKRVQEYLLALGAGFLLALVLVDLIPESIAGIGSSAPIWMLLGFSVIHLVEHTIVGHLHFGEETHPEIMLSKVASYSAFGGLFIHAFFDGLAISAGMFYNFELGTMIFLAILLHKFPEGLTIASIMLAAKHPKKTALLASAGIGGSTMLGILMIFFLKNVDAQITGFAFAFSAGSALYVGASDLIPEINHSHHRVIPVFVFVGMLLFYVSAMLVRTMIGA